MIVILLTKKLLVEKNNYKIKGGVLK
jgi:hypothetical protein